jgi:hypothetical protein
LTNNCVAQQYTPSPKGKKVRDPSNDSYNDPEEEEEALDNIWSTEEFNDHINQHHSEKYDKGTDLFTDII